MITSPDLIRLSSLWSELEHPSGDEAIWRSAISRAYYGAFHSAVGFLGQLQIAFPKRENEHKFAQEALNNSGDTNIRTAAYLLSDLRHNRNLADYELTTEMDVPKLAKECNADAIQICNFIAACPSTDYSAIKAAILRWRWVNYQL
jgi:uncharacterized protein (UPF0332 family)